VFIAQIIHEIGHAICAALCVKFSTVRQRSTNSQDLREVVPILSVGASLFVFLPSAFVRLSSAAIESLSPPAHLRIIAAGPFHNLILWCLLALVGYAGIGRALWSVSYRNVSTMGRVVVSVEPVSSRSESPDNI
jgi:S2P endopeptidase